MKSNWHTKYELVGHSDGSWSIRQTVLFVFINLLNPLSGEFTTIFDPIASCYYSSEEGALCGFEKWQSRKQVSDIPAKSYPTKKVKL